MSERVEIGKLRVLSVAILIGALSGVAVLFLVPAPSTYPPGIGYPPSDFPFVFALVTVLQMVCVAVLATLVGVYLRTYRETRTPFALGLTVFLMILLLAYVITSPLAYDTFRLGLGPGLRYPLFTLVAFLEAIAFSLFLYLSL